MSRGRKPNAANAAARDAAFERSDIHFHGMPCPSGHTKRYVRTGTCVECLAKAMKRRVTKYQPRQPAHRLEEIARLARDLSAEIERARIGRESCP
jgi:hypothetical protein